MGEDINTISSIIKVFGMAATTFVLAVLLTPALTHYMYTYKLWRKDVRDTSPDGTKTPLFAKLHKDRETRVPRFGGVLIWLVPLIVAFAVWLIAQGTESAFWDKANFLSRNQTWLPLFVLIAASLLGLADDFFQVFQKGTYIAGGIKFRHRLFVVFLIALAGALWFHYKLDWNTIYIPGIGDFFIGWLYIPLFILTMIVLFASSIVDGIDGLAGGVFVPIFGAFAGIAFIRGQIDIATLSAVILGALLAFLWFNIPPARFYMGESGILGLTSSLTVIAFLTDSVFALPIIGFVLMVEVASDILQFCSKKFFGRKLFLIAPIHHHFEALGWPPYKVTMRFWIISIVAGIVGMVVALIGR